MVKREKEKGEETLGFWLGLSYALFKGMAEKLEHSRIMRDLRASYEKGGFTIHFRGYLAMLLFTSTITPVAAFALSFAIHYVILGYTLLISLALSLIVAVASLLSALGSFIAAPMYRSYRWRKQIDPALPHVINYMQTLASAGLPVEAVFERVAEARINPALTKFAKIIVTYVKLFGMDIISALRKSLEACPNVNLSRIIMGLIGVVSTSGDLRSYLAFEGETMLRAQRDRLRRLINSLSFIAEVYVGVVIVGPIVFIIMNIIFLMLGGTIMGLSPELLMMAFIFIGIPVLFSIFLVILDSMLAGV